MEATRTKRIFPKGSKWLKALILILVIGLIAYVFRIPILRSVSSFLINADPVEQVDILVVLGGSPIDRGTRASEIFQEGFVSGDVYCTGGHIVSALEAFKIDVTESGLTRNVMVELGVPESKILELKQSTSTWEEAEEIKELIKNEEWKKIGIISSEYHIRRVRWTFDEVFDDNEQIDLLFFESDSDRYQADSWWMDEESFLITFGEYTKLLFYLIKY